MLTGKTARQGLKVYTRAVIVLLAGTASMLRAGQLDAIYAFGDSLSDVGNVFTETSIAGSPIPLPPYVNGQFSNGNVWVQDLATGLGLAPLTPSLLGGTNYAYGSGETGVTAFNTSNPLTDLLGAGGQLSQFQTTHTTADPNALYTIWIGSNDIDDILANSTPPQYGADLGIVAGNIDSAVNTLAGMGARNFLILTVPDLGDTPAALALGPLVSGTATVLSSDFNSLLVGGNGPIPSLSALATADSVKISVLDTYSLLNSIVANRGAFGMTNVTQPCLTGAVNYSGGTVCTAPNQYLFWDPLHPTAAAHQIVANEALSVVTPEPGTLGTGILVLLLMTAGMRASTKRKTAVANFDRHCR